MNIQLKQFQKAKQTIVIKKAFSYTLVKYHFINLIFVNFMSKTVNQLPETGSAKLIRHHMFNVVEQDIDVPDGDIQWGRRLYNDLCAGCHNLIGHGPKLINIYGAKAAQQKEFTKYSNKLRCMRSHRWSKQRLFAMLQSPQQMFGIESAMLIDGMQDPYMRACIIEYIHFMRLCDPFAAKTKQYMKY